MSLPSLDPVWPGGVRVKPWIYILEVRRPEEPDGEVVARLLLERQCYVRKDALDGSVQEASIRIDYVCIEATKARHCDTGNGFFAGSFYRSINSTPCVSLTSTSASRGAVFLDPAALRGHRVGTYLMNEVVAWVRQWPDAEVKSIELLEGQSQNENKARRNRFYEQFGLVFDYRDAEHRAGLSRPIMAKELTTVATWQANLRERDVREFIGDLLYDHNRMKDELLLRVRALEHLRGERKLAVDAPVWWALQQLWWRHAHSVFVMVVLGAMAAAAWIRYGPG